MKKLISLVLSLVILCCALPVLASTAEEKALFDVTSLGIMKGDENGDLQLDKSLTRAEFATIILRLTQMDYISFPTNGKFSDVPNDAWYTGSVNTAAELGFMAGFPDGTFRPDESVSYQQAVKTLVVVLGYEKVAEDKGGYPMGYINAALGIDLLDSVKEADPFTRGALVQLLYNALDAPLLESASYSKLGITYAKGQTLRESFIDRSDRNIIQSSGIVTANIYSWINSPNSSLEAGEVEIDDVVYSTGDTNAASFIGQKVEFYYEDFEGTKTILGIRAANQTVVTDISSSDIRYINLEEVKNEDNEVTKFSPYMKVIKNNRLIVLPTDEDLQSAKGIIRMIDNDRDKKVDVIICREFENLRVHEVKEDVIEFTTKSVLGSTKFFQVDADSENKIYSLCDRYGRTISVEDVKEDDIVSISTNPDKTVWELTVSDAKVTGKISEVGEDFILIDGVEYSMYEDYVFDTQFIGANVTVYLDYMNYVAEIEEAEEESNNYLQVVEVETYAREIEVKAVLSGDILFEYDEGDDPDDKNTIPVLVLQNSAVEYYKVADSIKVNGTRAKSNQEKLAVIVPGTYRYTLDSDGKLKTLESAEYCGGGVRMTYNVYDKVFAGNSYFEPVQIDQDTKILCLPTNTVSSDDDYFVPLKITNAQSNPSFYVQGYDIDPDTKKVKLITYTDVMNSSDTAKVDEEGKMIAMVSKKLGTIDEDDNDALILTLVTKSGEVEYEVSSELPTFSTFESLQVGDLIYYAEGIMGDLQNAKVIASFGEGVIVGSKNEGRLDYQITGCVTDMEYDVADVSSGNLMTEISVNIGGGDDLILPVPQRNAPVVFIFDKEEGDKVQLGKLSDIMPDESGIFYALVPYGTDVKACVIYR